MAKKKKEAKKKDRYGEKLKKFQSLLARNPIISPTEAAFEVFNCKDKKVAAVIANQCLKKLNVTLKELIQRTPGMSDEEDLEHLVRLKGAQKLQSCNVFVKKDDDGKYKINENSNDFIEVDDNTTQLNALKLSNQLKDNLTNKVEVNGKIDVVLTLPKGLNEDDL